MFTTEFVNKYTGRLISIALMSIAALFLATWLPTLEYSNQSGNESMVIIPLMLLFFGLISPSLIKLKIDFLIVKVGGKTSIEIIKSGKKTTFVPPYAYEISLETVHTRWELKKYFELKIKDGNSNTISIREQIKEVSKIPKDVNITPGSSSINRSYEASTSYPGNVAKIYEILAGNESIDTEDIFVD
ncbi:MAG TPA: hypothetical protein PLP35_07075 [Caldisericia bacterium]|nr:hypothetical protein [Caldisericia bacterium]